MVSSASRWKAAEVITMVLSIGWSVCFDGNNTVYRVERFSTLRFFEKVAKSVEFAGSKANFKFDLIRSRVH